MSSLSELGNQKLGFSSHRRTMGPWAKAGSTSSWSLREGKAAKDAEVLNPARRWEQGQAQLTNHKPQRGAGVSHLHPTVDGKREQRRWVSMTPKRRITDRSSQARAYLVRHTFTHPHLDRTPDSICSYPHSSPQAKAQFHAG